MNYEQLHEIGIETYLLLRDKQFKKVSSKFGYALAFGRSEEEAFRDDFIKESEKINFDFSISESEIRIKHFEKGNETGLISLIEIFMFNHSANSYIEVDLILNSDKKIFIEDVSAC
jgi:hypothetical protein